jgi:Rrf2 family protein
MLSMKAKYGLLAVLSLARESDKKLVLISELAEKENIPKKFLEQILRELKNQGILESKVGKGGGYYLNKSPQSITIGQIIRTIDGTLSPVFCVSQTAYAKCKECHDEHSCAIRLVMKDVRDAIANILDKTTLAEALERSEHAKREQKNILMYNI